MPERGPVAAPQAHIFLIGLMGAGKSTVGKLLAKQLRCPFIDVDKEIETAAGVKIPLIFEYESEEGFRRRETEALRQICQQAPAVISTGGGLPIAEINQQYLQTSGGKIIYLHAVPQILYERTKRDQSRPLLQVSNRFQRLQQLYEQRDPIYRRIATTIIDSSKQSVLTIVHKIIDHHIG